MQLTVHIIVEHDRGIAWCSVAWRDMAWHGMTSCVASRGHGRRRHVYRAGMGVPVLKLTASELSKAVILSTGTPIPAQNRRAVGDAEIEMPAWPAIGHGSRGWHCAVPRGVASREPYAVCACGVALAEAYARVARVVGAASDGGVGHGEMGWHDGGAEWLHVARRGAPSHSGMVWCGAAWGGVAWRGVPCRHKAWCGCDARTLGYWGATLGIRAVPWRGVAWHAGAARRGSGGGAVCS